MQNVRRGLRGESQDFRNPRINKSLQFWHNKIDQTKPNERYLDLNNGEKARRGLRGEPLVFWNHAYRDSGMTELTKINERF